MSPYPLVGIVDVETAAFDTILNSVHFLSTPLVKMVKLVKFYQTQKRPDTSISTEPPCIYRKPKKVLVVLGTGIEPVRS